MGQIRRLGEVLCEETDNVRGFAACRKYHDVLEFRCCKMGTSSLRTNAEGCRSTAAIAATERHFSKNQLAAHKSGRRTLIDRRRFYFFSVLRLQISISSTLIFALVSCFSLSMYLILSNKP